MFRYYWFIFSADLQFRRAIVQPNDINTAGLGINPSPKLIRILYTSTQCHCYTFLMISWQLLNVSDEGLQEHVRTQPLEALNWAEYNSRIFYVLTFPELFQYGVCRISLHEFSQIFCVHAVLRVIILFLNLTNRRILSSLFENLRNARDKILVCKNSKRIKTRETVLLTRRIRIRKKSCSV